MIDLGTFRFIYFSHDWDDGYFQLFQSQHPIQLFNCGCNIKQYALCHQHVYWPRYDGKNNSVLNLLCNWIQISIGFYIPQKLSRTIFRISIALWCLMAVVICNAYTGTFISFLTVPKLDQFLIHWKNWQPANATN